MSREKLLVVIGQAVDGIGLLAFIKLMSVGLSKDELGAYFLAASVLALLTSCAFSVLDQGVMRQLNHTSNGITLARQYSLVVWPYAALLAIAAVSLWGATAALPGLGTLHGLLPAFLGWMCFEVMKNTFFTFSTVQRRRGLIATVKGLEHSVKLLLAGAILFLGVRNAGGMLWVLVFSSGAATAALAFSMRFAFGRFQLRAALDYFRRNLRFVWPLFVWGAFSWLQNMSNRWILQDRLGGAAVADYSVAVTVASMPVTFLAGLVASYAVPIIYQRADLHGGAASSKWIRQITMGLTPVLAAWILVNVFFHQELSSLFASAHYTDHSRWQPAVALGAGLQAVGGILAYQSYAMNRTSGLLLANILPGVVCLMCGLLLIPAMGVGGAILAFLVSNILFFLLHVVAFFRNWRQSIARTT